MSIKDLLKEERTIWHKRFIPSLIAGVAVAIITFFFDMTASNIVMFASLGASAAILTHKYVHKLTILRTVIVAYVLALVVSIIVIYVGSYFNLSFSILALIAITLAVLLMYLFDVFHPPAASATLSFIMIDGGIKEDLIIFFAVIILLIIIKVLTYVFYYGRLEFRKIWAEVKDINKEDKKKIKKIFH